MKLHQKIKTLRLSKNFTQNYMADELGIDTTNYSRLEKGECKITVNRLAKIAQILETDLNQLLIDSPQNELSKNENNICTILLSILIEIRAIRSGIELNNKYTIQNTDIKTNKLTKI